MTEKPSMDELILSIDDVYSIDNRLRTRDADGTLKSVILNKNYLLKKCDDIKRVMNAYLEDAPALRGYIITIDDIETQLKSI